METLVLIIHVAAALGIEQLLSTHARPLAECEVDDLWRGRLHVELQLLETLSKQIAVVDRKLEELGRGDDRVKLLQTVPGVGPRLAEAVVSHLDDPHRFRTARQVSAYAGLVPKQLESGTMKRVRSVIAASAASGSMLIVSGSISTKMGTAPKCKMGVTVAIKVLGGTMTSSPGCIPAAANAICRAPVPLLVATP